MSAARKSAVRSRQKSDTHAFTTELARMDGGARHHLVPVPDAVAADFKRRDVRRLLCTLNGHEVRRALQNHADDGSFIIIGQPLLAELGLKEGSALTVELRADPHPDEVDIPDEFAVVLAQDDAARSRWETFTPGFKRSLMLYVSTGKLESTRIKRSLEVARKIRSNTLYSDRKSKS